MSDTAPKLPPSEVIRGVRFTGRHAEYTQADTWYPSWGADDVLYSPWTDGSVGPWACGSFGMLAATGTAKILGADPTALEVVPLGTRFASSRPYGGRYPSANLVHGTDWFLGTYCLDMSPGAENWDVLGPFVGFRTSSDLGRTWHDCPHTPDKPLFPESGKDGAKVKVGAPHVVDHGRELEHSPDGLAYLVAHGAERPDAPLSWITGDQAYLLRVPPTAAAVNDLAAYEFFAGHDEQGRPRWSREFADLRPVVDWPGRLGCVTATYLPGLRRYLLCASSGWPTTGTTDTVLLEAPDLTGPWSVVADLPRFGPQAYFVNVPSKFVSADGRTAWLCYSANYTNRWHDDTLRPDPAGSQYSLCLQELELMP